MAKNAPPSSGIDELLGKQRAAARVSVNHEFTSLEEFIAEYVSDISRSGVFIRTQQPLPLGTRVDLRFTVIADEIETVEGTGTVVRLVSPGEGTAAGMGVAFETLSAHSELVVTRLVGARPHLGSKT